MKKRFLIISLILALTVPTQALAAQPNLTGNIASGGVTPEDQNQAMAVNESVDSEQPGGGNSVPGENSGETLKIGEGTVDSGIEEKGTETENGTEGSQENSGEVVEEETKPEWTPGWNLYEGNWYYANSKTELRSGWIKYKSKWYYLDGADETHPGIMVAGKLQRIDNRWYAFDANGIMQTGWIKKSEGWYYANKSGALCSGWVKVKGKWYYLDPANETNPLLMKSDEVSLIDGKYYSFNGNGAMQTGWIKRSEGWYYANKSGAFCSGWVKVKNKWYYLDPANETNPLLMKSNEVSLIDGKYYSFNGNGAMQTGWIQRPEGWYYANKSGAFRSGWVKSKSKWYYLDPTNEEHPNLMVSGTKSEINGKTYTFEANGAMRAGWYKENENWYYFGTTSGQMVTGWQTIGGSWYYFYDGEENRGVMAKDTVIDGYVIHSNGKYIRSRNKRGWQNPSGYPQVSSLTVKLPGYCKGYFTYVTPSRISIDATRQECVDAFIARAREYLGTRYIEPWSSRPGDAVDCSGLVLQCLYATGMDMGIYNPYNHRWLPSQTYNSMNWYHNKVFKEVSVNNIQRGDLIYYKGHVAIYLGGGQIIDSWPGQGVSIRPIGSRGRVIGAARPFV